ncbi:hypothetical protein DL96DRAFT_1576248 [Flagelloscypha sp. PMI_526]|nr:hypothetical protein DL96DRAFT_1576248 [Flagelloscypha sp. PMI_526]
MSESITSVFATPSSSPVTLPPPILSEHESEIPSNNTNTIISEDPFDVKGLVVVITGGGTGLGLLMARALEHRGAIVYITGRRFDVLQSAAKENSRFQNLIPVQCDVTSRDSLTSLVEVVKSRHGYVDLLICNAGVARNLYAHPLPGPASTSSHNSPNGPMSPPHTPSVTPVAQKSHIPSIVSFQSALWDTGTEDDFALVFQTNVTAVYYTTVAFLDLLHRGNIRRHEASNSKLDNLVTNMPDGTPTFRAPYHSSQVISVSSGGGFRRDARVLSPSYTLSKAACTQLGKLLANLLAPWGIRSNCLAPGVWPTDMTTSPAPGFTLSPEVLASVVPLQRVGTEEDITGTILFLASRAGAYMNGAVLLNDGGRIGTVPSSY